MRSLAPLDSPTDPPVAFALTQADIDDFKRLMRETCGEELDNQTAWARVIELLNLYRMLLGPIPEDPAFDAVRRLSHLPEVGHP